MNFTRFLAIAASFAYVMLVVISIPMTANDTLTTSKLLVNVAISLGCGVVFAAMTFGFGKARRKGG
jgi:multisubunit Na+/H+ antiporter MnhB subunit